MWQRHGNRLLGVVIIALCALLWFVVVPIYVPGEAPAFFPKLAIAWITVFAALTSAFPPTFDTATEATAGADVPPIVGRVVARGELTEGVPSASPTSGEDERLPSVYGLMALWAVYVVAIGPLGFYIATFLMLMVSMFYLGIRRIRPLLLRPAMTLLVIYVLLDLGLNFRLPEAFWQ